MFVSQRELCLGQVQLYCTQHGKAPEKESDSTTLYIEKKEIKQYYKECTGSQKPTWLPDEGRGPVRNDWNGEGVQPLVSFCCSLEQLRPAEPAS